MVAKQFWSDYGYIVRGKQRRAVIEMMDRPMTVTELKKKTNLSLSEASRVLRGFKQKGLAECITPENVLGRVYTLTQRAKAVRKKLLDEKK